MGWTFLCAGAWLVVANAGLVWGLDGWLAKRRFPGHRAEAIG
jgi:hypothetical protein